jgi:hypothetical protein
MADALTPILKDPASHARVRRGLEQVRAVLGDGGASARAARVVMEML